MTAMLIYGKILKDVLQNQIVLRLNIGILAFRMSGVPVFECLVQVTFLIFLKTICYDSIATGIIFLPSQVGATLHINSR